MVCIFQEMCQFHLGCLIGNKILLIVFPYHFNVCRIYGDASSFISDTGNVCLFFLFFFSKLVSREVIDFIDLIK